MTRQRGARMVGGIRPRFTRAEFRREMLELRAEVADVMAEETRQRVDADIAAQRVLDARTERLV